MMKMKAVPIASAIPSLIDQDPKVEMSTDFDIAVGLLQKAAQRMKSVGPGVNKEPIGILRFRHSER
jgi:hypothetical protein